MLQASRNTFFSAALMAAMTCGAAVNADDQQDYDMRKEQTLRTHDFDVEHYRVALTLDEDSRSFDGKTDITFSSTVDRLGGIKLDAETFTVTSVTGPKGYKRNFIQTDGKLLIHLPTKLAKGESTTLTITYEAKNIIIDSVEFGMMEGYDLGIDFQPASETNPQLINSLNFPEGARHWIPSFDHPSDWATHETIITVKSAYKVLANGSLISDTEDADAGTRTVHWSQTKPQPTYLYVFVAGPYSVLTDSHGDLPVNYWVYPGDEAVGREAFKETPNIIAFLEDLYGTKYPWDKYDQIIIPGVGGGAESTGATLLGERVITMERAGKKGANDWLIAHELAHHWWGDLIGYKDWQHVWLAESFATHGEYLYSKHALGPDEGALNLLKKKNRYLADAKNKFMRPIVTKKWDKPNHMFDTHAYEKGSVILNMFREIVGAEMFTEIMQAFLSKHGFDSATTEEFFATVQEVTGEDYGWFFDQWLLKAGHPVLEVSTHFNSSAGILHVTVEQVQGDSNGVPVYRLPFTIGVTTAAGKTTEQVELTKAKQVFSIKVNEAPLMVRFDEGDILLKEWTFNKTEEELTYQIAHDNNIGRMWAEKQLKALKE